MNNPRSPTEYKTDESISIIKGIMAKLDEAKNISKDDHVQLNEQHLMLLCDKIIDILHKGPMLLNLDAPISVCGDLHGQFTDLMKFLSIGDDPAKTPYLFLGDYVDRGHHSVETISKLFCLKVLYPENIYLLRGNHETSEISDVYGFREECELHYSRELWEKFNEAFNYLPLAAVISNRIFCVHGGLSPEFHNLAQISQLQPPLEVPEHGLILDLLWADPSDNPSAKGFTNSERGTSFTFGSDVAMQFLRENDFDLICRAHQVVPDGFQFPFYPNQSVVTVFSAPNYCEDFNNKGAMLKISERLVCSFKFVEPSSTNTNPSNRPATPLA